MLRVRSFQRGGSEGQGGSRAGGVFLKSVTQNNIDDIRGSVASERPMVHNPSKVFKY